METVTIKDVTKNERDWYEVTLEGDDRVLATKDEKIAEAATKAIGELNTPVSINTRTKGTYTNHYVEEVNGVKGDKPKFAAAPRRSTPGASPAPARDNERIARQWAFGRAVELLMASDTAFDFPLSPAEFEALKTQAQALLDATK